MFDPWQGYMMTQDLQYTFSKHSTDPFDDWFHDEREPLLEEDTDEVDFDSMDDKDEL